jgi:hypothetical protein
LFCYTTTTTQAESLLESVKLRRLHVWLPPYTNISGTSSSIIDAPSPTCTISINCAPGGDNFAVSKDVTLVAGERGAYYSYRFRGVFDQWISLVNTQVNANTFLKLGFVDTFPIVQLDFSYQFIVAGSAATAATSAVGSVVDTTSANATVFFPLDNYASSGTEGTQVLTPLGLAAVTVNDPSPLASRSLTTPGGVVVSSSSSGARPVNAGRGR